MTPLLLASPFEHFGPTNYGQANLYCHRVAAQRSSQLRNEVRRLCPRKPGVYGMLDRHGELVYIGKAKSLRVRLLGYFRVKSRDPKAAKIISQTRTLVWEVHGSEFAALLREWELIRRWRPRWNVQLQPLRRRLTFVCLGRQPAPYVFLTRHPPKTALASYGPLPSHRQAQEAVRRVNDLFRLRDCPRKQEMVFPDQGELFPQPRAPGCLRMEIGACLGPCTGTCSRSRYRAEVAAARRFFSAEDRSPLDKLKTRMEAAAREQQFERAALLRDQWTSLTWLTERLDRLRSAREKLSFIYPIPGRDRAGLWFFLHGGRAITALPAPHDADTRDQARAKIQALYRGKNPEDLLPTYEHADGLWLVASWFRKYPNELKKTLTPAQALAQC